MTREKLFIHSIYAGLAILFIEIINLGKGKSFFMFRVIWIVIVSGVKAGVKAGAVVGRIFINTRGFYFSKKIKCN